MIRIREKMGDPQRIVDIHEFFDLPVEFIIETARKIWQGKELSGADEVDRWQVERALDSGRIYGPLHASAFLGVTTEALKEAVKKLKSHILPVPAGQFNGDLIFSEKVLEEWSFRFIEFVLERKIAFGNLDQKARRLVETLQKQGINAKLQHCSFEEKYWDKMGLQESEKAIAHLLCAITHQPVAIQYTAWLDNGKPISLKPDRISWQVLIDDPKFLSRLFPNSVRGFDEFKEKWGI